MFYTQEQKNVIEMLFPFPEEWNGLGLPYTVYIAALEIVH